MSCKAAIFSYCSAWYPLTNQFERVGLRGLVCLCNVYNLTPARLVSDCDKCLLESDALAAGLFVLRVELQLDFVMCIDLELLRRFLIRLQAKEYGFDSWYYLFLLDFP